MGRTWTPSLAIGIPTIDDEHKELFVRANLLLEAMALGQGPEHVGKVLEYLEIYVQDHFLGEERLMKQARYTGFIRHKRQHDDFRQAFESIKGELARSKPSPALVARLNNLVSDWLVDHISTVDLQMGKFLAVHRPALAVR